MKRNVTSLHTLLQVPMKSMFVMLLVVMSYSNVFSQSGTAIDFGYLTSVNWKATQDLNSAIALEHSKVTLALTAPNMPLNEKATFMAYQRMLNYVQSNLQAGKPANESITISYEQVLAEAPKDPVLAYMPEGMLETFVPGLVESLTLVPVPGN